MKASEFSPSLWESMNNSLKLLQLMGNFLGRLFDNHFQSLRTFKDRERLLNNLKLIVIGLSM